MSDLDLPDVNVLVALLHPGHVHHGTAQRWFAGVRRFATTPITEAGFLRVSLNTAVMGVALRSVDVLDSLRSLRSDPRAEFLADDSSLAQACIDLVGLVGHRQIIDLHLVNLAATHRARLVTLDTKIRPTLVTTDQNNVLVLT
ncbi:MAG: PIN domain-containing protein [Micrococcales bacterium]|nr:PIN domain-containing protein [Micrococcales bacterium]